MGEREPGVRHRDADRLFAKVEPGEHFALGEARGQFPDADDAHPPPVVTNPPPLLTTPLSPAKYKERM